MNRLYITVNEDEKCNVFLAVSFSCVRTEWHSVAIYHGFGSLVSHSLTVQPQTDITRVICPLSGRDSTNYLCLGCRLALPAQQQRQNIVLYQHQSSTLYICIKDVSVRRLTIGGTVIAENRLTFFVSFWSLAGVFNQPLSIHCRR